MGLTIEQILVISCRENFTNNVGIHKRQYDINSVTMTLLTLFIAEWFTYILTELKLHTYSLFKHTLGTEFSTKSRRFTLVFIRL